jgi:hypothetical protein
MTTTQPTTPTQEAIQEELLRFSNVDSMLAVLNLNQTKVNEVGQIMSEFKLAWDSAPCDPEGATKEQDVYLDSLLEEYSNDLLKYE